MRSFKEILSEIDDRREDIKMLEGELQANMVELKGEMVRVETEFGTFVGYITARTIDIGLNPNSIDIESKQIIAFKDVKAFDILTEQKEL